MFCTNCGQKNSKEAKYCESCGKKISPSPNNNSTKPVLRSTENVQIKNEEKLKLQKIYNNAGNSSFALSIFSFIVNIFVIFGDTTYEADVFTPIVISAFVLAPFFHFGRKLKKIGVNDIQYSFKVSKGLFVYTIVSIVISLLLGSAVGILWLILLYYFYKAYRETKKLLHN